MYIVCIVCRPDRSHAIEDGVAAASSIYMLGCGVFIQLWKDRKVSHNMNKQKMFFGCWKKLKKILDLEK